MDQLVFGADPGHFSVDGVPFRLSPAGSLSTVKNDETTVFLVKTRDFIRRELEFLTPLAPRRVLEFGVYQGGSAAFWSFVLPLERYVGIDIKPEPSMPAAVTNHPRWSTVRLYGNTSQSDRPAVEAIIDREFGGEPLDVVMDDASHQYELTKTAFEIAFPRLREGGLYLIEDWGWAHQPRFNEPDHPWVSHPSLANLIFRIVLLAGNREDVVADVTVVRNFVAVRRGTAPLPSDFDLDAMVGQYRPLPNLI